MKRLYPVINVLLIGIPSQTVTSQYNPAKHKAHIHDGYV